MDFVNETGVGYGSPIVGGQMQNAIAPPPTIKPLTTTQETTNPVTEQPTQEELADKEQKELWAREDAIRKETQEREDNAYQRAVKDMRQAGVNPNLQSISGAQAGGGISSGTAKNLDRIENAKDRALKELMQQIEQNWKGNQNDLDRIQKTVSSLIGII